MLPSKCACLVLPLLHVGPLHAWHDGARGQRGDGQVACSRLSERLSVRACRDDGAGERDVYSGRRYTLPVRWQPRAQKGEGVAGGQVRINATLGYFQP